MIAQARSILLSLLITLTAFYVKRDDCNYAVYWKYFIIVPFLPWTAVTLRVVPLVLEAYFSLNPHLTTYI